MAEALTEMFENPGWSHALNQQVVELYGNNKSQFVQELRNRGATLTSVPEAGSPRSPRSEAATSQSSVQEEASANHRDEGDLLTNTYRLVLIESR